MTRPVEFSLRSNYPKQQDSEFQMDIHAGPSIASFLHSLPAWREWDLFFKKQDTAYISGAEGAQKALLSLSALENKKPAILIVPTAADIRRWEEDLQFFLPDVDILSFPVVEESAFKVTFSSSERLRDRMRALSAISSHKRMIVLASAVEVAQKLPPPSLFKERGFRLSAGDELSHDDLLEKLTSLGYERVDQVERCGHFSVRGDIVDVFAINEKHPFRLEFWGDEIDTIRLFDEDTQRSLQGIEDMIVYPMAAAGERTSCLTEFLSDGVIIYDEPHRCAEAVRKYFQEERVNTEKAIPFSEVIRAGHGNQNKIYIFTLLKRKLEGFPGAASMAWTGQTATNYQRQISLFMSDFKRLLDKGWKTFIVTPRQSERREIESFCKEYGIFPAYETEKSVSIVNGVLSGGFEMPEWKLAVFTAGDILGRQKNSALPQGGQREKDPVFF